MINKSILNHLEPLTDTERFHMCFCDITDTIKKSGYFIFYTQTLIELRWKMDLEYIVDRLVLKKNL